MITSFTDLDAWKVAHRFVVSVYVTTKSFPNDELYGLTNQIRRAVVSITSNIAEGFSRKNKREKVQFYYTSLGSLTEAQNLLVVSQDVGYLKQGDFRRLGEESTRIKKLLCGLIKSAQDKN